MHICVKSRVAALLVLTLVGGAALPLRAQSTAATRYDALQEQELRVSQSPAAGEDDFRVVVNRYWAFVRRYPTSGYADNALWQAANMSMSAFQRFGAERDKYRAIQLFQWLRDQYPHSSLREQAIANVERIDTEPANDAPASALASGDTTIRAIRREVLAEVVRVTVELDGEVPFYYERLEAPARVFFDLKGTKTVPTLADTTLRYDSGIVRQIRLGRHPSRMTRIVLDLENVSRFSVFTLYNPYRIVIDSEPAAADASLAAAARQAPAQSSPVVPLGQAIQDQDVETPGTRSASSTPAVPSKPLMVKPSSASAAPNAGVVAPGTAPLAPGTAPLAPSTAPLAPSTAPLAPSTAPLAPVAPVAPLAPSTTPSAPVAPARPSTAPTLPSANASGKFSVARQLGLGVSRIVIDAGHGGHDPGASAFGISEAELVLDVSLRLARLLQQQEGMEVVLTRQKDEFVSLEERTEIANRESADLFLSVHANASANATASGVETYFLNFALNPQAEAVAARENAASGRNMSSLPGIIKAIALNSKLNESRDFAGSVQRALIRGLRPSNRSIRDLGVKQAPFMVLIGASMPSVLAEISFVTNRQEARLLQTSAYRQKIAESLLAGILRYQQSLKKVQTTALK